MDLPLKSGRQVCGSRLARPPASAGREKYPRPFSSGRPPDQTDEMFSIILDILSAGATNARPRVVENKHSAPSSPEAEPLVKATNASGSAPTATPETHGDTDIQEAELSGESDRDAWQARRLSARKTNDHRKYPRKVFARKSVFSWFIFSNAVENF